MATKPGVPRVMLFIDGQNLYSGCIRHFGHGQCHPHLLADELLHGRALAGIRYYTGIHDPRINPQAHACVRRRLEVMRNHGVWTFAHTLKYAEHEVIDRHTPRCEHGFCSMKVVQKGREKGVDLRMGLDMLRLARQRQYDIALIISQDTDLNQAVQELTLLRNELDIWLAFETAYPFNPDSGHPNFRLRSCGRAQIIGAEMFDRIRDDTDYGRPHRTPQQA